MADRLGGRAATLTWGVVVLVGVLVLVIVFGLRLYPRLNSGQELLDDARPAFTEDRIAGARAGVNMVSAIVDLADPIVLREGGAAGEVPKLVAFVSQQTGLSQAEVLAALQENFPHTTALLQAIPLEDVNAELPELVAFLSTTLNLTPEQVQAALADNFPALAQSIAAMPTVTGGWDEVAGTESLTRFDGESARTVPAVRDYFSADVIPVLERQGGSFRTLDTHLAVSALPPIATAIGLLAILFALGQLGISRMGERRGWEHSVAWAVVAVVGVLVIVLVVSARLYPRLNSGQELLDDARPAFTEDRIAGARAGVNMVSAIVDLADPIVLREGGAAGEVPKLVAFVSQQTGLSQAEVLAALQENFPHTTALLQAIPLEDVNAELPELVAFLSTTLNLTPEQVQAALADNFPALAQSIAAMPTVTGGWDEVAGTESLTRFDGESARTVPAVRDYFSADVIPVLERQGGSFRRLESTWPPVDVFPPLLSTIGAIVILYGLLMAFLWRPRGPLTRVTETAAVPSEPAGDVPAVPSPGL